MRISLPPSLEEYVRRKVATGRYSDAAEVVGEALRRMREGERGSPRKAEIVAELKALEPELRRRGIASVALFGSVVHGASEPDSDIDVLIAVGPGVNFDLIDLVGVKNLISDRLGREADVVDRECLSPLIRETILAEAETVF